jgi:hypothetical protein
MSLGVSFSEWLTGSYWRLDAPTDERAIDVVLDARPVDGGGPLREAAWRLSGTVDAEHLASHCPVEGSVSLRLRGERRVPYRIAFSGDDGRRYELSGQKEWTSFMPFDSVTLLLAGLYDDAGEEVGRATLRFDLRADWARWLRSLRVHL